MKEPGSWNTHLDGDRAPAPAAEEHRAGGALAEGPACRAAAPASAPGGVRRARVSLTGCSRSRTPAPPAARAALRPPRPAVPESRSRQTPPSSVTGCTGGALTLTFISTSPLRLPRDDRDARDGTEAGRLPRPASSRADSADSDDDDDGRPAEATSSFAGAGPRHARRDGRRRRRVKAKARPTAAPTATAPAATATPAQPAGPGSPLARPSLSVIRIRAVSGG